MKVANHSINDSILRKNLSEIQTVGVGKETLKVNKLSNSNDTDLKDKNSHS